MPSSAGSHGRTITAILTGFFLLLAACGQSEPDPPPESIEDLVGYWAGEPEHAGQRGRFDLELSVGEDGQVNAAVSLPDSDVHGISIGPATFEEGELRTGFVTLRVEESPLRLTGVLPEGLVPVHSIPIELHRAEPPTRSPDPEPLPERSPLWSFETGGAIWAGLTRHEDLLYAGNDDGVLHALDAGTGEERFRFATGGPIRARPVIHGDSLLLHSDDGNLYRLDARSGAERWRTRLGAPLERLHHGDEGYRYDGYASAPSVAGGRIYVSHSEGILLALDLETGERLWEFQTGDHIASTPAADGTRVVFGSFDGLVRALDASTGELLWERDTGAAVPSSPTLHGGRALVGSRSYDFLALDLDDGTIAWSHYVWFSWIESSAVVRDGVAYVGSSDAQLLHALDAGSGELLWRFDTGGSPWGTPAVSEDAVFQGAVGVDGYFIGHRAGFFAVDRRTGRGLWTHVPEKPEDVDIWGFAASPAVGDGKVYAAGLDGKVLAFALP